MFETQVQVQLPSERMNLSKTLQTVLSNAVFKLVFQISIKTLESEHFSSKQFTFSQGPKLLN